MVLQWSPLASGGRISRRNQQYTHCRQHWFSDTGNYLAVLSNAPGAATTQSPR